MHSATLKSWWVMTPPYDSSGSYFEPPEYGVDVVLVHAKNKSEAKKLGWKEMKRRGWDGWQLFVPFKSGPPWMNLIVEYAACNHGLEMYNEYSGPDCPACAYEWAAYDRARTAAYKDGLTEYA